MKIVAILPLRKNSKRIKNKNLIKVGKKRLYVHTLNQAIKSKYLDKIYLAVEDKKFFKIKNKKKVEYFIRSKKSASPKAETEIVINEVLKRVECDYVVLIQATNLFLKTEDLDNAISKMINNSGFDSLLSTVNTKFFLWEINKSILCFPKNYNLNKRPRSQDIKNKQLIENGSFYIFKKKGFLKNNNRLFGNITFYNMEKVSLFEIDEKKDLVLVKKFF